MAKIKRMTKPIKIKAPNVARIVDTSSKVKRVSREEVARALGAQPVATLPVNLPPPAYAALLAQLVERRRAPRRQTQA